MFDFDELETAVPYRENIEDAAFALASQSSQPLSSDDKSSTDKFIACLDSLFAIDDDSDNAALNEAFDQLCVYLDRNPSFQVQLWRRLYPLMLTLSKPGDASKTNSKLFGLAIQKFSGIYGDDCSSMNETVFDQPKTGGDGLVVLILGWGGGSIEEMRDIYETYHQKYEGAMVARVACNRKGSLGLRGQCALVIQAAMNAWSNADGSKPRLLVHAFSNAGFATWVELLQLWEAVCSRSEAHPALVSKQLLPMKDVLRGVIFDSAPNATCQIEPTLQSLVQGCAGFARYAISTDHDGSANGKKDAEIAGRRAVALLISDDSQAKNFLRTHCSDLAIAAACADTTVLRDLQPSTDMLFIYSRDDKIVLCAGIEDFISEARVAASKASGTAVEVLMFEKSQHIYHRRLHKDEYWKKAQEFVDRCLA